MAHGEYDECTDNYAMANDECTDNYAMANDKYTDNAMVYVECTDNSSDDINVLNLHRLPAYHSVHTRTYSVPLPLICRHRFVL